MVQEVRFHRAFDELEARQAAGEALAVPALDAANAAVAALTLESPGAAVHRLQLLRSLCAVEVLLQ